MDADEQVLGEFMRRGPAESETGQAGDVPANPAQRQGQQPFARLAKADPVAPRRAEKDPRRCPHREHLQQEEELKLR